MSTHTLKGLKNIDFLTLSNLVTWLEIIDSSYTVIIWLLLMTSIFLLAIGIGIAVLLLTSTIFHFLTPIGDSILSPQEKKCQQIANEGYKIHKIYPDSNPDELPDNDFQRLMYLDELWIKECVSVLPADSILNIVNNVERTSLYGE